jgi:hypothetical protein
VTKATGTATGNTFTVIPPPTISGLSELLGPQGLVITLTGTNFTGATTVKFNGTAAGFTVVSATQCTATVPVGAASGTVSITTPGGTGTSGASFTVLPIFSGTVNSCLTTTPISSTGSGTWQWLQATNGNLVAAINDQGNALGQVTAEFYLNQGAIRRDGSGREYLDRNWHLTAQNGFTGQQVRVRFYARNTEFSAYVAANDGDGNDATTVSQLRLTQYSGPNEDCLFGNNATVAPAEYRLLTPVSTEQLSGANWFGLEAVVTDHFSEFFLNGGNQPLPVELVRFTAEREAAQRVRLGWSTASERRNRGFVVQRSPDGREFVAVSGLLAGHGTSLTAHAYEFLDALAPSAPTYYRLLQLDTDGATAYSDVVAVRGTTMRTPLLVWPNPAQATFMIQPPTGAPEVQIIDALGRIVLTVPVTGNAVVTVAPGLPSGVYGVRSSGETLRLVME